MQLSDRGAAFIAAHEGFVSRTYRDPAGVPTIGYGFTGRSKAFADYWLKTRGRRLRTGDTIAEPEARAVLRRLVDEEYGPAVFTAVAPRAQHHFDACCSVAYNCGPATLKDRWARRLAAGDIAGAATLLRTTRTRAGGRFLAGLARRRADEAALLERGDYGPDTGARAMSDLPADVRAYQADLAALGFYRGAIDGIAGPATRAAVVAFQKSVPHLKPDGIAGRATRAELQRARHRRLAARATAAAGAATSVAAGSAEAMARGALSLDALFTAAGSGAAAMVAVAALVAAWRHRGALFNAIARKETS